MRFVTVSQRVIFLFLILSTCAFSKMLHIFNPFDTEHVRVKTTYGITHLTNSDQSNCGWYTFEYYDDALEILLVNGKGVEYGAGGTNGGGGYIPLPAEQENTWLKLNATNYTIQNSAITGTKSCIGILSAEIMDWKSGDHGGAFLNPTVKDCGHYEGLVNTTLTNGLPTPVTSHAKATACKTSQVTNWFKPLADSSNYQCKDLVLTGDGSGRYGIGEANSSFFPIDNFNNANNQKGQSYTSVYDGAQTYNHNYFFCMQTNTSFTYNAGQTFRFEGDDDLWVYVDGVLAMDIGGTHIAIDQTLNMQTFLNAHGGAVENSKHSFDLFYCERYPTQSNLKIVTNIDFDQNEIYWNDKLNDTAYVVTEGNETAQGCDGSKQVVDATSNFWLSPTPFKADAVIQLMPGQKYFDEGIQIGANQKNFSVNAETVSNHPIHGGLTLAQQKYYVIHETITNGRTDFGFVSFYVFPEVYFTNGSNTVKREDDDNGIVNSIQFRISPASEEPLVFRAYTTDSTAIAGSDYYALDTTITIPAGNTSGYFSIRVITDNIEEPDEVFKITLVPISNVVLGNIHTATHTIINDDIPPTVLNPIPDLVVKEDAGDLQISIANVFDPHGRTLSYSLALINTADPSITSPVLSGTSTVRSATLLNKNGVNLVTLTADAGYGLVTVDTFSVTVTPVNDAPKIKPEDVATSKLVIAADFKDVVPLQRFLVSDEETPAGNLAVTAIFSGDVGALPLDSITILNVTGDPTSRDIKIRPITNSVGKFIVVFQVSDGDTATTDTIEVEVTGEFRIVSYRGADRNEDENFIIINDDLTYINIPGGFDSSDVVLSFPTPPAGALYSLKGDSIVPAQDYNGVLTVSVNATVNGVTTSSDLDIILLNTNDAPYDIGLIDDAFDENIEVCQDLTATDDDGDDVEFVIIDSDGRFVIKNGDQLCSIAGALDYEAVTTGVVKIEATDGMEKVIVEVPYNVVDDDSERSKGAIVTTKNVTAEKYISAARDSVMVLTNQPTVTVSYTVVGVDGIFTEVITLNNTEQNGVNTYYVLAQNPTKNHPDTLKVTVAYNFISPTVIVTDDDLKLDTLDGKPVERLVHSFTGEVQGTAFFDGSTIDTVYTNNNRLILDKYITLVNEDLEKVTVGSYISLEHYTIRDDIVNIVSDTVYDVFGNQTITTFYVVYDTIPPVVKIVSPADSISTSLAAIEVGWEVNDDGTFYSYTDVEELTVGTFTIERTFMDLSGNVGRNSISIEVVLEKVEAQLELKESLIELSNEERAMINGDIHYYSGVYVEIPPTDVGEETGYKAVFGDHSTGQQKVTHSNASNSYDEDVLNADLEYENKRGPEIIVTMTFPSMYPLDSEGKPMTFMPVLWNNTVSGTVNMYDMMGQYLNTYTFEVPLDDPAYYTEEGTVRLRFMIYMRGEGDDKGVRTRDGRHLGTGVYLLTSSFTGISEPATEGSNLETQRFVENKTMKVGYFRPKNSF